MSDFICEACTQRVKYVIATVSDLARFCLLADANHPATLSIYNLVGNIKIRQNWGYKIE